MSKINYTAAAAAATTGLVVVEVKFGDNKELKTYAYLARHESYLAVGDLVMVPVRTDKIPSASWVLDEEDSRCLSPRIKVARIVLIRPSNCVDIYSKHSPRFIFGKVDTQAQSNNCDMLNNIAQRIQVTHQSQTQASVLAMLGISESIEFGKDVPSPIRNLSVPTADELNALKERGIK
jgi:hypothetical protein